MTLAARDLRARLAGDSLKAQRDHAVPHAGCIGGDGEIALQHRRDIAGQEDILAVWQVGLR